MLIKILILLNLIIQTNKIIIKNKNTKKKRYRIWILFDGECREYKHIDKLSRTVAYILLLYSRHKQSFTERKKEFGRSRSMSNELRILTKLTNGISLKITSREDFIRHSIF